MANTPINQFSEDGMRRIAAAVRRVEQTPTMRQTLDVRNPTPQAREIRWARTTTSYDYPTYPSSGPAYVVEFGDYATSPDTPYPGATITKSFTAYDPAWKEVAVDPSGGTWAESTVVRVERNGGQWWIRPTASATVNPVMFFDAIERGVGATYPRGGGYSSTEYYTFDFQKVRGDYAANNLTPLDAFSAGMAFVEIEADGAYEYDTHILFDAYYNGSVDETYTTSDASTGTSHTHTVTAWRGKEMFPTVYTQLQYQVGGSGSWTLVPQSQATMAGIATDGTFQTGSPFMRLSAHRIVNLTAGWTIRQVLGFSSTGSLNDHVFSTAECESLVMRYLGEQFTDTTIT